MSTTPSMTLSLADAKALAGGSVWSEMGTLHQVEALLAQAVAKAEQTGQPVDLVLRVENK